MDKCKVCLRTLIVSVIAFIAGCATNNSQNLPPISYQDTQLLTTSIVTPSQIVPTSTFTPSPTETPTLTPTITETPTPTEEPAAISINPDDSYMLNFSINQEEISSASDEKLLEIAPSLNEGFDFTKLGFKEGEVESLASSGEVVKVGSNKFIPYLNQEGEVIMGWDVEKGEMVHFNKSIYTDEQTGIRINSYIYTDNGWAEDNKTWWELNELDRGDLSKAFFDYPLALNYMWEYHREEFFERLHLETWESIDSIWVRLNEEMNLQEIKSFQDRALQLFRQEINGRIEDGEETKLQMARMGDLTITGNNLDVLYKINYGGPYLMRSYSIAPFGDYGNIRVENGLENQVVVNINSDRYHRNEWGKFWVGDYVTHSLRGMTAGGDTITRYGRDTKRAAKSLADNMMFDICGEETMERYLAGLGDDYLNNRSVPLGDPISLTFPTCLATERIASK